MSVAFDINFLLEKIVLLTRNLGRIPVEGDLLMACRNNPEFPSKDVFRKLGLRSERISRVIAFCETNPEYNDVAALWKKSAAVNVEKLDEKSNGLKLVSAGFVYLLKHGSRREYKIGRTSNPLRREGEVGIQLPEKLQPLHYIETDDPAGIEAYWHNRFADKRKEGEWFALTQDDVRAFKRWKKIN
jgi:hypothetical protein